MDQQTLDRFTRMDELMERMAITLEQIAGKETEICVPPVEGLGGLVDVLNRQAAERENVWQLSYPKDGTRATLGVGTTDLDFEAGTITDYAGTVTQMSSSLRKQGKDWMQSAALNPDQDVIIQFDQHDKIPVRSNSWYLANYQEFKRLRITTTVSTAFFATVSTAPAIVDMQETVERGLTPFAYESKTVDATSGGVALTSGTYDDATRAEMTLETAQIRFRMDGTNPSATEGHLVEVGDPIVLNSAAQIAAFKAIRTGGTSGVLKATYFH